MATTTVQSYYGELILLESPTSGAKHSNIELTSAQLTAKLASSCSESEKKLFIIDGCSGSGKTQLCGYIKQLVESSHSSNTVVHVDLCKADVQDNEDKFLECCNLMGKSSKSPLFLFDGFDEFLSKCKWNLSAFFKIINSEVLNSGSLLIATRPSGVNFLYKHLTVDHHYFIIGFSATSMNSYFQSSTNIAEFKQVLVLLKHHNKVLVNMCKIPLICFELVKFLRNRKFRILNLTLTDIVHEIVLALLKREICKIESFPPVGVYYNLYSIPHFTVLSELAIFDLVHGAELDSLDSYAFFLSSFSMENGVSSLSEVSTLSLLYHCENDTRYASIKQKLFWFLTPEIRDFLAAFALHHFAPLDQLYFLSEHAQNLIESGYFGWLQFFYGLTVQREVENNPTRMMMASLNELLVYCLNFNDSLQLITFMQSLTEAKEPSLWKKLAAKNFAFFSMSLPIKYVEMVEADLVNLINSSGCREWVIEVSPGKEEIGLTLQAYIGNANLELREDKSLGDGIRLWPKIASVESSHQEPAHESAEKALSEAEKRILKIGAFFCKAVREILQRVFQLYSKMSLKGDCSNASYVSFFSCPCFEEAVVNKVFFNPILAQKFLSVPNASKKAGKRGNEIIATHLKEEHGDRAVELVILLTPCVRKVMFVLPSGKEVLEIVLSGHNLPDMIHERFISSFVQELEEVVQCCMSHEIFPAKTENVLPKIPVNTELSLTVVSSISLPPPEKNSSKTEKYTEKNIEKHTSVTSVSTARPNQSDSHDHLQIGALHYAQQVSAEEEPSLRVSPLQSRFPNTAGVAVQAVQQQPRRLANMKPGTVVFTNEAKIPIDRVLPLPDEDVLIRSGGNGQIFSCTIEGLRVAVKKTSYRSKEYSIITKVNHKNVVELLAFVLGEENPAHKRRYFCYHILPVLSGKQGNHKGDTVVNFGYSGWLGL